MPSPNAGNSYLMTYFTGQSYSPVTQGPISSISFSADFKSISRGDIFFGFKQGNSYYFVKPPPFTEIIDANWFNVTYSANLASLFGDIFTYAPPDFVNGAPLQFGIFMGYTTIGSGTPPFSIGMDNFRVTVTSVPEPSAMALILLGSGMLAMVGKKSISSGYSR